MKWSSTKQILKAKKLLRPDIETSEIAKKGGCNCCSAGTKNKRDLRLKRTKDFQLRGQGGEEAACSKNRDFHQTESLFWGLTDFLNPICGAWNMRLSRAYFIFLQSVVNNNHCTIAVYRFNIHVVAEKSEFIKNQITSSLQVV